MRRRIKQEKKRTLGLTVSGSYYVTIPLEIMLELDWHKGEELKAELVDDGVYVFKEDL